MARSTTFYFVRHGEVHNPKDVFYGRLPRFRLSKRGLAQAQALQGFFATKSPIEAVYSSPLLRARQTARVLMGDSLRLPLRQTRLLSEVLTPYDGSSIALMTERNWDVYSGTGSPYEQPSHILARSLRFLQLARRAHPEGTVIAVTHAAVIYFLAMWVHHKPLVPNATQTLSELSLPAEFPLNGSVTQFIYQTADPDEIPHMVYHPIEII